MKKRLSSPRRLALQEGTSSSNTVPSRIDTVVKCYEDVEHVQNGNLCIEDYTLEGMETSSMMCFADWGEQRCSSCTYSENLCYDSDTGRWGGGYKLICNNVFTKTRSMTVCDNRIQYNMRTSGSQTVVLVVLLVVIFRAWMARCGPSSFSHLEQLPYQSVPLNDNTNSYDADEEDGDDSLTELSPAHNFAKSPKGGHHVSVD